MESEKRLFDPDMKIIDKHFNKRLIDANNFRIPKGFFDDGINVPRILDLVAKQRTVDAVEVVHGRWTPMEVIAKKAGYGVRYYHHAECKVNPHRLFECENDYCPNCGAKMDGERKEDA